MSLFRVRDVLQATPRTRRISIDFSGFPFAFKAGQAVLVGLPFTSQRKPYSIASSPQQAARAGAFELLVQIEDATAPEPHLELVAAGSDVIVEGPFGSFGLPSPVAERDVLFIAGGTGIAPLRSILWNALETQEVAHLALIYSARTTPELVYAPEFTALADEGRLALHLTVTRSAVDHWHGARGRIDAAVMTSMLRTLETRCLVCGPPPLVADATALLRQAGVAAERILTESYAG